MRGAAALLALGVALAASGLVSGRVLLGGLAGAVLVLAAWVRWARARRPLNPEVLVTVDGQGVSVAHPGAAPMQVPWRQLVEVRVLTTSDGPVGDDVFLLLRAADGSVGIVPPPLPPELVSRLVRLPGFDHERFIEAMGFTTEAAFLCWTGAPGEALPAADEVPTEPFPPS